jgi:hypothetical protein
MVIKFLTGLIKAFKNATKKTIQESLFPNMMNRTEAIKILGLNSAFTKNELESKFKKMHDANSFEKNKGSPYIQSRIQNAHDLLCNDF